jgi:cell division protein FtsB
LKVTEYIFSLPHRRHRGLLKYMPRRVKQSRSILGPLAENFLRRLASTDRRLRRKVVKYGSWVLGLLFCYSLMAGTYSLPRIARLELERRALITTNKKLTVKLVDAARIRRLLESDPGYIEYIARTKYRMARPGETIFRYRGQ